ncbi:MAG: flagellar FliJ family protein [Rubrivivax sp.]|jgi:flagellar FliJ protein|nr:flagellar FliJ family protein [Rubrivivax sp.]
MTATTATPLALLIEMAETERDRAAASQHAHEQRWHQQQARQRQIEAYRDEYAARWRERMTAGAAVEIVRCQRDFMARLDDALALQRAEVQAAAAALERARQTLRACELRAAAVRRLAERRAGDEALRRARDEQRRADEAAMQAAWRARVNAPMRPGR